MSVAVDLMGGDHAPYAAVEGALIALRDDPTLAVTLVGPRDMAQRLLAERWPPAGRHERIDVVSASQVVGMDEDPARAVRAKPDATVRVAARLVRDGAADASVSVGATGAAVASAVITWGRLPGMTRPALAVIVPAAAGRLVLLDAGAATDAGADLLVEFALVGAAYAAAALDVTAPRVGLLTVGGEPGKGDHTRRVAHALIEAALADTSARFVGSVEGHDVALGEGLDVAVTDGFTGNVLLKGLEGLYRALRGRVRAAADPTGWAVADAATASMDPERTGGGVLLGVEGVSVVGHGASSARAVASCLALAAAAVRGGLLPRAHASLAGLVARRRSAAGLPAAVVGPAP